MTTNSHLQRTLSPLRGALLGLGLALLAWGSAPPARAQSPAAEPLDVPQPAPEATPEPGEARPNPDPHNKTVRAILYYLPNRLFDLLDPFRARVRFGPGTTLGARLTSAFAFGFGSHSTAWVGLPGPRMEPQPRGLAGVENYMGAEFGLAKTAEPAGPGPNYSPTECGVSVQLLLVGVDVDVDPLEVLDFVTGFFCLDLRPDTL